MMAKVSVALAAVQAELRPESLAFLGSLSLAAVQAERGCGAEVATSCGRECCVLVAPLAWL